jgi:hypothetical protein
MRHTEIIAICFVTPTKHASTLCGGSAETVMMKSVLHTSATLLEQVKKKFVWKSPFLLPCAKPAMGQDLLFIEDSWSNSDTPHSVGLLWTNDQPNAETTTCQHSAHTTDKRACLRLDSNPQSQQASGRRPHSLDRAATGTGQIAITV